MFSKPGQSGFRQTDRQVKRVTGLKTQALTVTEPESNLQFTAASAGRRLLSR